LTEEVETIDAMQHGAPPMKVMIVDQKLRRVSLLRKFGFSLGQVLGGGSG
jgi:hypothetical protein